MNDDAPGFLAGGGEMSQRTRELDWSQTPVGPIEHWPQGLKIAVQIMLGSRYAMWLGWGPEFTFFYNDAYAKMTLGPKHPWALGRSAREVWSEIWSDIGPRAESVLETGEATWDESLLLFLERKGFPEESYHTFSYSPLPTDDGEVGGMLCVVTEDTERMIGERRLRTLRELAARSLDEAKSVEDACQTAADILGGNLEDLPFTLIYLLDGEGSQAKLAGLTGVTTDMDTSPALIELNSDVSTWPLHETMRRGAGVVVDDVPALFGNLSVGAWPESPQKAMVLPLAKPGQTQLAGFLVAGVSPRLSFDDSYRGFLDLLAGQIATAVGNARAYEEERRRAEALAELDRAKTAFFSNVSHEFRTPLTLMLGPVEDMLLKSYTELSPAPKGQLEVVNRNGLRLLRLVNSLLDFSRIEAGRVRAAFQPTELAGFTAELASVFRSAVERAGLRLIIDCREISERAYVDRDMWEKIVLNLLSNAFKFTFEGEIAVTQRQVADVVELTVRDTGTGVPAEHMPRLFERFHRIENSRARTHEGSGIGLALVQELVKLHGGTITAESEVGKGTTFQITIPLGTGHLPPDQIGETRSLASTGTGATPFVEEALRWLPDEVQEDGHVSSEVAFEEALPTVAVNGTPEQDDQRPHILVADDNADMRQYVVRLLSERYRVSSVSDGKQALEQACTEPPDLVLTDVMMPQLDGFGLLDALRQDPRTTDLPVIMLSARAGEESRVEGMEAGADDYLVKPFSARELLARVGSHLQMARLRRESAQSIRESEERLRMALAAARMVAWEWDPIADRVVLSDNAPDVFGLPHGFVLEKSEPAFALVHPDDVENVKSVIMSAVAECGAFQMQFRMIRPDNGEVVWFEERGHAVLDDSGKTARLIGVVMDITERKRTEEGLQEREQYLRAIFDTTPECIKVVDADGALLQMNAAGLTMIEAASDGSVTGACVYDVIAPEYRDSFRDFNQRICSGERGVLEFDIVGLGGTRRHMETHAVPLPTSNSKFAHLALTRDVTERKRAEEALRKERDLLHVTLTSIGDAVITTDKEARVTNLNGVAESLTGWSAREAAGQPLESVFCIVNEETRETVENPATRALEQGVIVGLANHTILIRKDGREIPIDDSAAPIRGGDGDVVGCVLVFRDISERKRIEAALRESEEHFRSMADNAPAMLWVTNPDSSCTFLSRGWYEFTGQSEAEGLGLGWLDAVHPDDRERSGRIFQEANANHDAFSFDYRLRHVDGEYRWAIDSGQPRFDDNGDFLGYVGSVIDVHERKEAEEAQRRSAETFAALVEQSPLGIYVVDADFRIAQASMGSFPAFRNVQPVIGRDFAEVMHTIWPEDFANEAIQIFRHTLETGEPYLSPGLTEKRKDLGAIESYEWQVNRVMLADGRYGVVCYYFDTTRLQQALQALRESEERFRMLADNMSQLAWTCEELGDVNWYNQRWHDYTGYSLEEMQGWGWKKVHHPDHVDRVVESITKARDSGELWEATFPLRGRDGQYRWFLSRALPIRDERGNIVRWFGTNTDVTELRETQQLLHEADRRKDEFLATLAHELRNPLAPIRTGLELIKMVKDDPVALEETRSTMERQTQQLITLVDDLLDVSRITRGKLELRTCRVDLAEIVKSAVEASRPFIDDAGHKLEVSLCDEPVTLNADPHRLAQVLSNLLNNAAKYTPEGGYIWLTAERAENSVIITVKDTGIGIPSDMLQQIFEMFAQIDRPMEKGYTGLGIGLTLVKRLVEMHGGDIVVRSDGPDKGSELSVQLPILQESPTTNDGASQRSDSSRATGLRILVVDDGEAAANMLGTVVQMLGNEVRVAYDGVQAVEVAKEYRPDVILMDLGMPRMNGYEAARTIRQQDWGRDLMLVALTGWGQEGDRQRTQEVGFDHHLVKPAEPGALQELFARRASMMQKI